MSELHKFLFDGMPVRGMIVRLTDAWTEILRVRASNSATGAYPVPVSELLGEMAAAGVLMQSNIKFNGALVLQVFGDGPVSVLPARRLSSSTQASVRRTTMPRTGRPSNKNLCSSDIRLHQSSWRSPALKRRALSI